MALWIDLHLCFEDAFAESKKDLVRRFFVYAKWCLDTPKQGGYLSDVGTAVALAFYEHIVMEPRIRNDLHLWLSPAEFSALEEIFKYHLTEGEYDELRTSFVGKINS